jgi:hypothetical protein
VTLVCRYILAGKGEPLRSAPQRRASAIHSLHALGLDGNETECAMELRGYAGKN